MLRTGRFEALEKIPMTATNNHQDQQAAIVEAPRRGRGRSAALLVSVDGGIVVRCDSPLPSLLPGDRLSGHDAKGREGLRHVLDRVVKVRFDANTAAGLPSTPSRATLGGGQDRRDHARLLQRHQQFRRAVTGTSMFNVMPDSSRCTSISLSASALRSSRWSLGSRSKWRSGSSSIRPSSPTRRPRIFPS